VDMAYRAVSKNQNKTRYFKLNISDETDQATVLLFNDKIDSCKGLNGVYPKEGDCVIVKGQKKEDAVFASVVSTQEFSVFMKLADIKDRKLDKEEKENNKNTKPENKNTNILLTTN
ncbi:MAG: hypothetical protein Q8O88_04525, partial [bacterium]|nr:hypothetical protein [bacterium]